MRFDIDAWAKRMYGYADSMRRNAEVIREIAARIAERAQQMKG